MRRNVELRVGALVIAAIVAGTIWLLFLKEFKFRTATFPVHVDFREVAGITVGAPVHILGVVRGKVDRIELRRDHVRLTLGIEEATFISQDARFVLQPDLINPTSVRIEQGTSAVAITPGTTLPGHQAAEMGQLLEEGTRLVVSLRSLSERMDSLAADARLDAMLTDMSAGAAEMRAWTSEGREETARVLARIEGLGTELEGLVAETRGPFGEALDGMNRFSTGADSLVQSLEVAARSLAAVGRRLEAGEGSLGRMLESDEFYVQINQTVAELDSLITDIRQNPKKFVHFSLF